VGKHGGPTTPDEEAAAASEDAEPTGPPSRRRRTVLLAVGVVVGAVVVAGGWVAWRGQQAASALTAAQGELAYARDALQTGDVTAARSHLTQAQRETSDARRLTSGPVFGAARLVPLLGQTPRAVATVSVVADDLTHGPMADLVEAGIALDPRTLRVSGNRVDVEAFARAAPALASAEQGLRAAQSEIATLDVSATPMSVQDAVSRLQQELDGLVPTTAAAAKAAALVPPMLGADRPREYFLALQSNNEARGTGGFLGAFGVVRFDNGKVTIERLAARSVLDRYTWKTPPVDFGPDYQALYGDQPASWTSANLSPHYPYAAQLWRRMYAQSTGTTVDGVITVDPVALSYLLAVTGPVVLPDGRVIDSKNLVPFTENEIYGVISDDAKRDEYLQTIAKAAFKKILSGEGSPRRLLDALGRAAGERRLLLWSADPSEERVLATTSVGGVIPTGPQPFAGLAVINAAGNKLDYYLRQSLDYRLESCSADGSRATSLTVTLRNTARPGADLPAYVDSRLDLPYGPGGLPQQRGGDQFVYAQVYGSQGALLDSASLDGRPVDVAVGTERGKPVFRVPVTIPAGGEVTLVLRLAEPALPSGTDPTPLTFVTPLVQPTSVTADAQGCPSQG